jgi:hypothetical protein
MLDRVRACEQAERLFCYGDEPCELGEAIAKNQRAILHQNIAGRVVGDPTAAAGGDRAEAA